MNTSRDEARNALQTIDNVRRLSRGAASSIFQGPCLSPGRLNVWK